MKTKEEEEGLPEHLIAMIQEAIKKEGEYTAVYLAAADRPSDDWPQEVIRAHSYQALLRHYEQACVTFGGVDRDGHKLIHVRSLYLRLSEEIVMYAEKFKDILRMKIPRTLEDCKKFAVINGPPQFPCTLVFRGMHWLRDYAFAKLGDDIAVEEAVKGANKYVKEYKGVHSDDEVFMECLRITHFLQNAYCTPNQERRCCPEHHARTANKIGGH